MLKPILKKVFLCGYVDDCLGIQQGVEEKQISCINDEGLMNISVKSVSFLVNSPLSSQDTCLAGKGEEIWNCKNYSLGFLFLLRFPVPTSLHLCASYPGAALIWSIDTLVVRMVNNFWTWWQTKTGQCLNVFAYFCSVVDAKFGGGKKTLCVLCDLFILEAKWSVDMYSVD